jgi:hypothetical protein
MPGISRHVRSALLVVTAVLVSAGGLAATQVGSPATNLAITDSPAPTDAGVATTIVDDETTTSEASETTTTTTTTAAHVTPTTSHSVVTVATPTTDTSTTLRRSVPTTAPPTSTHCTFSVDIWPKQNMPNPEMYLHVTAVPHALTDIVVNVVEHGTTNSIGSKVVLLDGNAHADIPFALTDAQLAKQADVTGSMMIDNVHTTCDPNPWTTSLALTA